MFNKKKVDYTHRKAIFLILFIKQSYLVFELYALGTTNDFTSAFILQLALLVLVKVKFFSSNFIYYCK